MKIKINKKNTYTYGFIISLVMVIVLNCTVVFFNCRSKEYFVSGDKILSKTIADKSQSILASYDYNEYADIRDTLNSEYISMREYYAAVTMLHSDNGKFNYGNEYGYTKEQAEEISLRYNISQSQAAQRIDQMQYCISRLDYALKYPEYISKICSDAFDMSSADIFNETVRKKIIKTGADFYGLEQIHISAESEFGVQLLLSDHLSDISAVFAAIICALLYSLRCNSGFSENTADKSRAVLFGLLFSIGIASLYTLNVFFTDMTAAIGDPDRAVQSVSDFQLCPYVISVGTLISVRIIFKIIACLTVYLLCTGFFLSSKKIKTGLVLIAVAAVEAVLIFTGIQINFISEFNPQNVIAKYENIYVFDEIINPLVPFVISAVILLLTAGIFTYKSISSALISVSQRAEKAYLEKLNDRHTELRLIRHDMKNHLSAVAVLLDEGDTEGARKYLGEISEKLDDTRPPVRTGSAVLDALLLSKLSASELKKITVSTEFTVDLSLYRFTDYDLCVIFSNIIDNAIEACDQLPSGQRNISLMVKSQMDMVCIICENRYKEVSRSGGIFKTTKSDSDSHGLGIKHVIRIASKYGGDVKISAENNLFTISVLLMK